MTATIICNITLNLCGVVILLLLLPSGFLMGFKRKINRKKQQFLLYAIITHFFSLCTRLAVFICIVQQPDLSISQTLQITADILLFASAIPVLLCILMDENGTIRLPRGNNIPILQIIFLLIPPLLGIVLAAVFPDIAFRGISWAISLNLLQNLIWFDNEKSAASRLPEKNMCAGCSAPCENACVHPQQVPIRNLITCLYDEVKPELEISLPQNEDRLRTDLCGIPLENPFLLSSSVVASTVT